MHAAARATALDVVGLVKPGTGHRPAAALRRRTSTSSRRTSATPTHSRALVARRAPARGLQPRRLHGSRRVVGPPGRGAPDQRRRRRRPARGDRAGTRVPVLPGVVRIDLRGRRSVATDRAQRACAQDAVRRTRRPRRWTSSNAARDRGVHAVCGDPLQPRVAAARRGLRHPTHHRWPWRGSPPGCRTPSSSGDIETARDWGWAPDYVRGDAADDARRRARTTTCWPPGSRTGCRSSSPRPSPRPASTTGTPHVRQLAATARAPATPTSSSATAARPTSSWAGGTRVDFDAHRRRMVAYDMALLARPRRALARVPDRPRRSPTRRTRRTSASGGPSAIGHRRPGSPTSTSARTSRGTCPSPPACPTSAGRDC